MLNHIYDLPGGGKVQAPGGPLTADATTVAKVSPLVVGASVTTLTIPDSAVSFVFRTTQDLRLSEDSTMTRYCTFIADTTTWYSVPVAYCRFLYLTRDSSDATVHFFFTSLKGAIT